MPDSNSTAPKLLPDQNEPATPEDVATLYSWANLHGAKYREFSASRAVAREETRVRLEEAIAEEKRRQEEEAERKAQEEVQLAARQAAEAAEAARQAEADRLAEIARQAEAERQAVLAAQEAQRQALQQREQRAWQPPPPEDHAGGYSPSVAGDSEARFSAGQFGQSGQFGAEPPNPAFPPAPAPQRAVFPPKPYAQEVSPPRPGPNIQPGPNQLNSGQFGTQQPIQPAHPSSAGSIPEYPASRFALPQYPPDAYKGPQQEPYAPSPWQPAEARETREMASRPAWLAQGTPIAPAAYPPARQSPAPGYPSQPSPAPVPPQTQLPMYVQAPEPMSNFQSGPLPSPISSLGPSQGQLQSFGRDSRQGPGLDPGIVDDTLLGSRDRIANRWYALKSVFDPQVAPVEQAPLQPPAHVPVLAVFSLAGGVGKTSLVASLGRALSSRGERVLLVDTAAYGLLPFFFGARDQRPNTLRTFNPPGVSADAPIQLVTLDPEGQPPERGSDPSQPSPQAANPDWLAQEVGRYTRGANRVLIDLPTASGSTTRRVLRLAPVVLVPVLPDMNSVVSVGAIEAFFRNSGVISGAGGAMQIMPYYVLNQFDYSLPLHLDVREILREQIGDRLLPFALRRSPAVSEALAEGMTVMDYAPSAVVAEDYANLAGWVRGLSAPATQSYRGVRWSER